MMNTNAAATKTDTEIFKFKCRACLQSIEADANIMGTDIECPSCGKKVRIPLHVFSVNPFRQPILHLIGNLTSIQWHTPFFPQFIEAIVLVVVIVVTSMLYLTVGIASQIAGIFQSLMLDARHEIKSGSLVEKSAYAVAGGIYIILWLPFWILLLPFTMLGWIWRHMGYIGLIILAVILMLGIVIYFNPNIASRFGIEIYKKENGTIFQYEIQ